MSKYKSAPLRLSDQAGFLENALPSDVQILKAGIFFHDGRQISITEDELSKMVENYKQNVRGIDLMLDYGHDTEGEAAAWFTDLYLSEDRKELWGKVSWTEGGKDAILTKKYRYISADFDFNYTDNETMKKYGPTLYGAGLTNRPVVKKMQPVIQLSEKINTQEKKMEEKVAELYDMMKSMLDLLGAMKDADEENVELMKKMAEKLGYKEEMEEKESMEEKEMAEDKVEMSDEKNKSLLSENARLIEENKKLKKEGEFNKLFSEGKVVLAQKEAFLKGDMVAFTEAASKINTENTGNTANGTKKVNDAEAEVIKLAEKICKDEGEKFGKAVTRVLSENPALAKKYREKFN